MIGTTVTHYKIIEKLGEGGMGVVYKAQDTKLNRPVALKFLPQQISASEQDKARFIQEAQAAAALNHPSICTIHGIEESTGEPFIVMEYVEGQTLRQKLMPVGAIHDQPVSGLAGSPLPVNDAIAYATQIGEALQEAHSKGITHRDVKPENIMVNAKNQIKVMDFGLAKLKGSLKLTRTSSTVGTLAYMSPEQIQGAETDARSDIFSFGIVLYEMLSGRFPFRGEHEAALMYSIVNEEPQPLQNNVPDAPPDLVHILNRLLEKNPDDRYQTMTDVVIELRRLKRDTSKVHRIPTITQTVDPSLQSIQGASTQQFPAMRVPFYKRKATMLLALGVLALIAVPVALFVFRAPQEAVRSLNPKRVVVAVFENQTGDPSFDPLGRLVAERITQGLSEITTVEPVPTSEMLEATQSLRSGNQAALVSAQSLAEATNAGKVVSGSYYRQGENLQFQAQITDANTRSLFVGVDPVAGPIDAQEKVIEAVAQRALGALAFCTDPIDSSYIGIVHPPTLESYRQYKQGTDYFLKFNYRSAIPYLQRAVDLDSLFFLPSFYLLFSYSNLGQYAFSDSLSRLQDRFRGRMTIYERAMLDAHQASVARNHVAVIKAMKQARSMASTPVVLYLIGSHSVLMNRHKEGLEALLSVGKDRVVVGTWVPYWDYLTFALHRLGNHAEELKYAREGRQLFPDNQAVLNYEIRAQAAVGNLQELEALIVELLNMSLPPGTNRASTMMVAANELAAHGFIESARKLRERALEWYRNRPPDEQKRFRSAYASALYSNRQWDEARSIYVELEKENPQSISTKGRLGCLAARTGDRPTAMKYFEWLQNLDQPYTYGDQTYWQACIMAILGEKDRAMSFLRDAIARGQSFTRLHADVDLEQLQDYPAFQELIRPKE